MRLLLRAAGQAVRVLLAAADAPAVGPVRAARARAVSLGLQLGAAGAAAAAVVGVGVQPLRPGPLRRWIAA